MNARWKALVACLMLMLANRAAQASVQETVKYIHTDAVGSIVAVTNANGQVIERRAYEPYGAQLLADMQDGPGYTGHVQDAATGLVYMQQRYYDPQIGRFLSVDPVTAYENPNHHLNRYRYANDNPYRFIDPDGRCPKVTGSHICNGASTGSRLVTIAGPASVRAGDQVPTPGLTDRPIQGNLNSRDLKTATADGGFDPTGSRKLRSNGARRHQGVDIAADAGAPVVAAAGGIPVNRNSPAGYGIYIDIDHGGGLSTRYAHLQSSMVENGQYVRGGEKIGEVGRTGNLSPTTQSHLHFEVRQDNVPQDPNYWFRYDY